ncbi:signal peptidase I [Natronosalvus amylolyticus]|uniref:signal peptidase I n=1 Tax=Natronosalvus amylolyticus TaxID=2961994 RepID=UPI0020C9FDF8|nr:signal peptidase I [Natronosalvus amylolyticus]
MSEGWVSRGLQLLVVVAIVALLAGHLLGQPVLLGYVETGSMEPTLEPGDGFVAVPSVVASDPEPGDVVVFDAQEIEGGGLTTHRIVDERPEGYVTQGDANPFTDQDGGEPPVQDAQIVATVAQPTGSVLTIPALGTVVMAINALFEWIQTWMASALGLQSAQGTTGAAYVLLGISLAAYAIETVRERRQQARESRLGRNNEEGLDPKLLCGAFALMVMVAALGAMVVPAGTHSYDVVSAQSPSDRPLVIEQGETERIDYPVENSGFVPVLVGLEGGDGVSVEDERLALEQRGSAGTMVAITAPADTGAYQRYVTEYRYLYVLPSPVISGLASLNPWLPVLVITGLMGGVTYGIGRILIGDTPAQRRSKTGRRDTHAQRSDYNQW